MSNTGFAYDGKHWNIYDILPYQRNFNFINGVRSIGKTYTCLKFFIHRFLKNGEEFFYLTRTADEIKNRALQQAVEPVLDKEFKDVKYDSTNDAIFVGDKVMCYARALSQTIKMKKERFPNVRWLIFDEYMLEPKYATSYVKGWNEPDLFLNTYHTIDREEDRVTCFLLGNNTSFYNPYHLHPAFNIPECEVGQIWKTENILFQRAEASAALLEEKKNCKFLRMIKGTEYDRMANQGIYVGDNMSYIEKMPNRRYFNFTIKSNGEYFGVWTSRSTNLIYISRKRNPSLEPVISMEFEGLKEGEVIARKDMYLLKWMKKELINGRVRYDSMDVKMRSGDVLRKIV